MNLSKKLLSLLLCAVMVLGSVAVGGEGFAEMLDSFSVKASAFTDGIFTYDVSGGEATVTGCDLSVSGDVTIPSALGGYSVTAIGDNAFFNCSGITSIFIPDSVTFLGQNSFALCTGLTGIVIPNSVTKIDSSQFYGCSALESIHIPSSVVNISVIAFLDCSSLKSICSDSNNCYAKTFAETNGYSFRVCSGHAEDEQSEDEILYTVSWIIDDDTYEQQYCYGEAIVPPAVPEKEGYDFYGWTPGVPAIMPDSDLEFFAIYIASQFKVSWIVNGETYAEQSYFYGRNIVPPENPTVEGYNFEGWTPEIPSVMPASNLEFEAILVPKKNKYNFCWIIDGVFSSKIVDCGDVIELPSDPEKVGWHFVGWYDYDGNKLISGSTMPAYNLVVEAEFEPIDYKISWIVDGVTYSEQDYYYGDTIVPPDPPTKTGYNFYGWSPDVPTAMPAENLEFEAKFSIPTFKVSWIVDGETYTEQEYCYAQAIVPPTDPRKEGYRFIGWFDENGVELSTDAIMTEEPLRFEARFEIQRFTVSWIVNGEVYFWQELTFGEEIVPPPEPSEFGYRFTGWLPEVPATMPDMPLIIYTELEKITPMEFTYVVEDGEATITGYSGQVSGPLVIPERIDGYPVTGIGSYSFYNCINITGVSISDSIRTISNHAFYGCRGLRSITIGESVSSIGSYAFYNCTGLTEINWNAVNCDDFSSSSCIFSFAGKDSSGVRVFFGCFVEKIPAYLFTSQISYSEPDNMPNITAVMISNSVTSIGDEAFCRCEGLTEVIIPYGVSRIGKGAFSNCANLSALTLSDSITDIDNYAFSGCKSLLNVIIPDSVTRIGDYAFYDCFGLTSVNFGHGVNSIGNMAFSCCTSLTSLIIPDNVTAIGEEAFGGCISLTDAVIPNHITALPKRLFLECESLVRVNISEFTTSIGEEAFSGCTALKNIIIPEHVERIGYDAFCECTGLETVIIPDRVTYMGECVFKYCIGLRDVVIGNGLTEISNEMFSFCYNLKTIHIPENITSIGDGAFAFCRLLESITIPENVSYIGSGAFLNCWSLETVNYNACNAFFDNRSAEYSPFFCCPITEITVGGIVESLPAGLFGGMVSAGGKNLVFSCPDDLLSRSPELFVYDTFDIELLYEELYYQYKNFTDKYDLTLSPLRNVVYYPVFEITDPSSYLFEYVTEEFLHYVLLYDLQINNGEEEMTILAGETVRLSASAVGTPDSTIDCSWKSYNKNIAQVDAYGNVTGISCGTATITATAPDGSTASIDIVINHTMIKQLSITPTCVQEGGDLYICSTCGISKIQNKTPALGHSYSHTTVAPTCEADGYDFHRCIRCGDNYTDNITPAFGHDDEEVIIRQTCIQDGYVLKICKTCGRSAKAEEVPATGHTFTNWATITAATEGAEGLAQRHCTKCGYTEDKILSVVNRTTFYVTFVANGKTVATVEYVKGAKTINEPAVPHKDRFTGEWEPYTLNDRDITVNARYTVIDLDTVSGIEASKNATYNSATGEATVNIHAASEGKTVISTSAQAVPLDIILVVDQSGSMAEKLGGEIEKKDALINSATAFVNSVYEDAVRYNVNHRVAIVGFGMGNKTGGKTNPAFNNTEILTTGGLPVRFDNATASDYAAALMSVNCSGNLNPGIVTAINNIEAKGATAADCGLSMANSIFANTDGTGRQRIVVFMTDGAPTTSSAFENKVASAAILQANELKNTYGATVYSVGVMSADDTTPQIDTFMNYVSSNYSDAESMSGRYKKNADGYCIKVENTNVLTNVFTNIVTENITRTTDFDNITVIDTVSKYFTLTTQQEKALRVNAIETYGVKNSDIEITRNDDGTTTVIIRNISPVDTGSSFEVNLSFNVSANENAAKAGTYATNTDDAGIIIGNAENYECVLDVPTVTIPQDRKVSIFKINGEVFEISSSAAVTAPATDFAGEYEFSGWNLENGTAVSDDVTVYDASYVCKQDYIVVWNTAEGTQKVSYTPGDVITEPDAGFDIDGNAFRRWNGIIPVIMPAESIEFTAAYGDHEHQYISETVKPVTCLENGTERYTCSVCGDCYEVTVPCPGHHSWKAIAGSASDEYSFEEFECETCGEHSSHCLEYIITDIEQKEDGTYNTITNEFNYYDENGNSVQPDGYVNITVPVEEYFGDAKNVEVYRVNSDGSRTKCDSTFAFGILKFLTNHFSTYEFVISDSLPQPTYGLFEAPMTLSTAQRTLKVGDTGRITVSSNYTVERKTWSSDNPSVASVDSRGTVTALGEGECTITVISYGTDSFGNQVSSKAKIIIVVFDKNPEVRMTRSKFESQFISVLRDFLETLKVIFRILAPFMKTV